MRFARLLAEGERVPAGLEEVVRAGQLDLLQHDYTRPRVAPIPDRGPVELPEFAAGFAEALRPLVKTLYLEPEFRVIASAGWSAAFQCIERAATVMVEGGCGDLPVSAVRGSHLLPILEMLSADGLDLTNAETGAPWRELQQPLLAADLKLGAGPLATALAEQARVIVAGYYDAPSPATALAVAEFGWSWDSFDLLAAAALAARAATWFDWQAEPASGTAPLWQSPRIELNADGSFNVEAESGGEAAARRLQEWLRSEEEPPTRASHADVRLDLSRVNCEATGARQIRVHGVRGAASDVYWPLEVLYQAGYMAETMIEFSATADTRWRRQFADIAKVHLPSADDVSGLLTVEELQPTAAEGAASWLHVGYRSSSRQACQHFADQTLRLVAGHQPLVRLATGPPAVFVHCGLWPARVPRDAVDIAVETRLAREWI